MNDLKLSRSSSSLRLRTVSSRILCFVLALQMTGLGAPSYALAQSLPDPLARLGFKPAPGATGIETLEADGLKISISPTLPYSNSVDAHHTAFNTPRTLLAAYATRSAVVEDLLDTRKALKVLIGGDTRLHKVAYALKIARYENMTFQAPPETVRLYDLPNADSTFLPESARAIRWLRDSSVTFDRSKRRQLLSGLAALSTVLVRLDAQIKYIEEDFWESPKIESQLIKRFVEPHRQMSGGTADRMTYGEVTLFLNQGIKELRKLSGSDTELQILRDQRQLLLSQYKILGQITKPSAKESRERGSDEPRPLYQLIYGHLEKMGFPKADAKLIAEQSELPTAGKPIALHAGFDRQVAEKFEWVKRGPRNAEFFVNAVEQGASNSLDRAFIDSLKANTAELIDLCKQIHFNADYDSALGRLVRFDEAWKLAEIRFGHLLSKDDFANAQKAYARWAEKEEHDSRMRSYGAHGAALFLGGAGIIGGLTKVAEVGGFAVRSLVSASSAIVATEAFIDYRSTKTFREMNDRLLSASQHVGDADRSAQASDIEAQDYWMLIGSMIVVGTDLNLIAKIWQNARVVTLGNGQKVVRLIQKEVPAMRASLLEAMERSQVIAPFLRGSFSLAQAFLGASVRASETLIPLSQAITDAALMSGKSVQLLTQQVMAHPVLKRLVPRFASRMMVEPKFREILIRETVVAASMDLVGEVAERGDQIFNETPEVGTNLLFSVLLGGVLVDGAIPLPGKIAGKQKLYFSALLDKRMPTNIRFGSLLYKNRLRQQWERAKYTTIRGGQVMAFSSATSQIVAYVHDPNEATPLERAMNVLKTTLYTTAFVGLWSVPRGALNAAVLEKTDANELIAGRVQDLLNADPKRKIVLKWGVSLGNNYLGAVTYVKAGRALGVQGGREEGGTAELTPQTGYIRIEDTRAPGADADYLFDFLNQAQ